MILLIASAAQRDIDEAVAFYEAQRKGLGLNSQLSLMQLSS